MQGISKDTIKQAALGDLSAFEEIYKHLCGFVYNVAFRMLRSAEDSQEITQYVFVTVYNKLKYFRLESSLKTWLYRITFNLSINYLNKRNKERNRTVSYEDAVQSSETNENFKKEEDKTFESDQETLINTMLEALNPDQKACIILRNVEGLSYQEIAESLKINVNTVRTRLKRAREKLIALRNEGIKK